MSNSEDLTYDIFIHDSTKYVNNLEAEIEMVKISSGETKEILFTKSNLNLISTDEDHCVSDDTDRVTRNECLIKLVSELKPPFFWSSYL